MKKKIKKEWKRSLRNQQSLSLIMLDIDFFKEYNDTYGHLTGDECLKKIANILSIEIKRSGDFLARYGGEEFIIILSNTDKNGALNVSKKIKKEIKLLNIPHKSSSVSKYVTVSLGITSTIPEFNKNSKDFINTVDNALYKAKQNGRDQIFYKKY